MGMGRWGDGYGQMLLHVHGREIGMGMGMGMGTGIGIGLGLGIGISIRIGKRIGIGKYCDVYRVIVHFDAIRNLRSFRSSSATSG